MPLPHWVIASVLRILLLCIAFMPLGEVVAGMAGSGGNAMAANPGAAATERQSMGRMTSHVSAGQPSTELSAAVFAELGAETSSEAPDLIGFLFMAGSTAAHSPHLPQLLVPVLSPPLLASPQRPPDPA